MVPWVLMFAVVITECVSGRPLLPPLPMKDGCYLVSPEVGIFRLEGEAVILTFPIFMRVLKVRNIAPDTATYVITKNNGTEGVAYQDEGRVQQSDKQLWFLPAEASDSGEYLCSYRNDTYCITGSTKLHVYQPEAADMKKLSYPISAEVGEKLTFRCPSISDFNKTDSLIEWHKASDPKGLQLGPFQQDDGKLLIPAVTPIHAGVYTCLLRVLINNHQYRVSRTIQISVEVSDPVIGSTPTVPDLTRTSNPGLIHSSSTGRSRHTPVSRPPVIISPLNGTIFETSHGSGLALICKVVTECPTAESTVVTWLLNGQSVESFYLDGRALQGGRRVTRLNEGCQIELRLLFVAITEEDLKAALTCVTQNRGGRQEVVALLQLEDSTSTWMTVSLAAASCFLTVVFIFLYLLFKPKRKMKADYILASESSTF